MAAFLYHNNGLSTREQAMKYNMIYTFCQSRYAFMENLFSKITNMKYEILWIYQTSNISFNNKERSKMLT